MDKLSVQLAVNTVIQIARSEDIKACSIDAMKSIEMMGLTHRAEAALIEAGLTYGPTTSISISVSDLGKIRLSGLVENKASKTRAEEVLKTVKGVGSIENQIRIAPADRHV
jgi:osmotically-inducible protein OsmY